MDEEWRSVVGYEGHYEVSSLGRVRSVERLAPSVAANQPGYRAVPPRILALVQNGGRDGTSYVYAHLCKEGRRRLRPVHRLVAAAFLPDWDPALTVNHVDGVKAHNAAANLEMATVKENIRHAIRTGLRRA